MPETSVGIESNGDFLVLTIPDLKGYDKENRCLIYRPKKLTFYEGRLVRVEEGEDYNLLLGF